MILIIIGCLMIGAAIGFITATLFKAGADHNGEIILRRTMAPVEELEAVE